MNNDRKIIRYNTQTGEPIYEDISNQPINTPQMSSINPNMELNNQPINTPQMSSINPNTELNNQPINTPQMSDINPNMELNNQPVTKKTSSSKSFGIIVGILVFVIVAVVTAIVVLLLFNNKDSKPENSNINEYDNNTNTINNTNDNTNNDTNSNYYTYEGFEFNKHDGFEYSEITEGLNIESDTMSNIVGISEYKFSSAKDSIEHFKTIIETSGITVENYGLKTVDNNEIIYYEISYESYKAYCYFIESPNSDYTFEVIVSDISNEFSDSILEKSINLVKDSKYIGNYSDYNKELDVLSLNSKFNKDV